MPVLAGSCQAHDPWVPEGVGGKKAGVTGKRVGAGHGPSRPRFWGCTPRLGHLRGTLQVMTMTATEVRSLPAIVDVVTAAEVLGIGRTVAY